MATVIDCRKIARAFDVATLFFGLFVGLSGEDNERDYAEKLNEGKFIILKIVRRVRSRTFWHRNFTNITFLFYLKLSQFIVFREVAVPCCSKNKSSW